MDLITEDYRQQNALLHKDGFGGGGHKHEGAVVTFAAETGSKSILDYGCGRGSLARALRKHGWPGKIHQYDPAVARRVNGAHAADLLVSTDVLEHIEPQLLDNVIDHMFSLTKRAMYLSIATRPANKILPDGRNAHLILEEMSWWLERLSRPGWTVARQVDKRKKGTNRPYSATIWLTRASDSR